MNETALHHTNADMKYVMYRRWIIMALIFGILINATLFWYISVPKNVPLPATVMVTDLHSDGPTTLCPGDTLKYEYRLDAAQPAVVDVSTTTLPIAPGVINYGSETARQPIPTATKVHFMGEWLIPETIPPGEYVRVIALSSPGRYAVAFGTLSFKVVVCTK